jgi:hypothetical protein
MRIARLARPGDGTNDFAMENRHPPDGIGYYIAQKRRYKRPIVLTKCRLEARLANLAKANAALHQIHVQLKLGTREPWQVHPVPIEHRCTARSKQTGERCRRWGMKKPDGSGFFRTCLWHGAAGALGRVEYKIINGRRMGPRQVARYEKRWRERAEAVDAAPPKKLPPLY